MATQGTIVTGELNNRKSLEFRYDPTSTVLDQSQKYLTDFKYPTTLHETESNYALSVCYRQSFIHKSIPEKIGERYYVRNVWHRVDEPEPWQEKIMDNFQEFVNRGRAQYKSDYISDIESSCSESDSE